MGQSERRFSSYEKFQAYTPFGFRYSSLGEFLEALTSDLEGTGMEINNSRYEHDSQTCTCVLKNCLRVF